MNLLDRLDPSIFESKPPSSEAESPDGGAKARKKFWRYVIALDIVSVIFWADILVRVFIVDWASELLEAINPDLTWLVNFRLLGYVLALFVLVLIGKKLTPLWLCYILLWPLLLLVWRIPFAFYKRDAWNGIVGLVHVMFAWFTGLKATLAIIALFLSTLLFLSLPGDVTAWMALCLAAVLQLLVLYYGFKSALRPSKFTQGTSRLVARADPTAFVQLPKELPNLVQGDKQLTRAESELVLQTVQNALMQNYLIRFVAYRLVQYQTSPALVLFSVLSMIWLFLGSVVSITLMNEAAIQMDPASFADATQPSVGAVIYYSIVSLYGSETTLLQPIGGAALLVKIFAAITGPIIVIALLASLIFGYRLVRNSEEAARSSAMLAESLKRFEDKFVEVFNLSTDVAFERFRALNNSLVLWLGTAAVRMQDSSRDKRGV
jgi:hypothetical protein